MKRKIFCRKMIIEDLADVQTVTNVNNDIDLSVNSMNNTDSSANSLNSHIQNIAECIWEHSMIKNKLHYTELFSDGYMSYISIKDTYDQNFTVENKRMSWKCTENGRLPSLELED